jgi:phospholipid/cholesterol/gamma-HCH transport system ATP-binding protein
MQESQPQITVRNLEMAYSGRLIQRDISFTVRKGEIFMVMGGSGCGKSTLLRHMVGLQRPVSGEVFYRDVDFWGSKPAVRERIMRRFGVLYQGGALWSSMTLVENVALPLEEYTDLGPKEIRELASLKLALVGLVGFEEYYPAEISGGMRKRAGLARAMALDPEILFFDEPSGGLDPVSAKLLDDLIMQLRDSFGTSAVIVTHELASILSIADNSIFLDTDAKTMIAEGNPKELLAESTDPRVRNFLTRGKAQSVAAGNRT